MESLAAQEEDLNEYLRVDVSDSEAEEQPKSKCGPACGLVIMMLLVGLVVVGALYNVFLARVAPKGKKVAVRHAPDELFHKNHSNMTRYHNLSVLVDKPGDNKSFPKVGDFVVVEYTGTLADGGFLFDTSSDRGGNYQFRVGHSSMVEGFDQGVRSMSLGEKATLHVPSSLAYGEKGKYPAVPEDADLDFTIHLLDISPAPKDNDPDLEITLLGMLALVVIILVASLSFRYKDYVCAPCFWWMGWKRRRRVARTRDRRLANFDSGS